MNILYLANINNLHDFKWISFFAEKTNYNIFLLTEYENFNVAHLENSVENYESIGVTVLQPIHNFSFSNFPKTVKSILRIRKYIKRYKIDCFHTLFGSPQPIWLNFLPNSLPLGITTRGSDVLVQIKNVWEGKGITNLILKFLFRRGYKRASFITCTSNFQIDGIKKYIGNDVSSINLIKTGVDVESINTFPIDRKVKTTSEKFVFSARFLAEVYNVNYQVEALKLIDKSVLKDCSFLFVKWHLPTDVDIDEFKSQLDQIIGLKYDICEKLTQPEMWATIKASAVTFMVPKSDGTPNTALECMASKTPFILGDLEYNKELFGCVSLIANLEDPQSLATQIEQALLDYPEELIENGYNKVKELGSRESQMKKLNEIYKSVVQ